MYKIVPSRFDKNYLFHILNNLIFGGNCNIKDLRDDIQYSKLSCPLKQPTLCQTWRD